MCDDLLLLSNCFFNMYYVYVYVIALIICRVVLNLLERFWGTCMALVSVVVVIVSLLGSLHPNPVPTPVCND